MSLNGSCLSEDKNSGIYLCQEKISFLKVRENGWSSLFERLTWNNPREMQSQTKLIHVRTDTKTFGYQIYFFPTVLHKCYRSIQNPPSATTLTHDRLDSRPVQLLDEKSWSYDIENLLTESEECAN